MDNIIFTNNSCPLERETISTLIIDPNRESPQSVDSMLKSHERPLYVLYNGQPIARSQGTDC